MLVSPGSKNFVLLTFLLVVGSISVAQSHDIAIVAASEPLGISDVESKLEATGYFDSIDSIDIRNTTPTLSQLEQYCAILVFTDSPILDPAGFGNVLADYVDRGGAVVTGMLANVDRPTAPLLLIQGRWKTENYWVIQPANFVNGIPGTMNNIHQPGHPILTGVSSFDGGPFSPHLASNTLHPEAFTIAAWSYAGNIPVIATREIKSVRRADLGFWPVSTDAAQNGWNSTTDGDRIIANALVWVCPFDHSGPAVAVMGSPTTASWNYDVRAKILSQRAFSKVDVYDTNLVLPSLNDMKNYCSILVYTDSGVAGPDPISYGNNLADYIDSGGGVVTAAFSHSGNHQIVGRFDTDDYWVIEPSGPGVQGNFSMGTVFMPEHPLMTGVQNFDGGTSSFRSGDIIHPDATRIADWTTGEVLMASRNINGIRRADLGFYPPSNDARGDFWDATTNGARIMANALLYTCPSSKPAVAILGSDSTIFTNQEIQDKIKLSGKFSIVDTIGIAFATPSVNQLLPYSAVLVWSNISLFDPVKLGNDLADYVDAGGGVVLGFASYAPSHMIQGRFNSDNYWVLTPGGSTLNGNASIGTVYIPTHPILSDVTSFDGGLSFRQSTTFEALANPVATWSDGQQLITTRLIQNRRRVDLNFFPPSSDSLASLWDRNTDGAKIMANALAFVGVKFQDDFSDSNADDWDSSKGTWTVSSGVLTGTSKGKADNFAPYQCNAPCSIGADVTIDTADARASILGWSLDKKTFVEVQLMEDKNKIVLTQKSAGVKVAKTKNVFFFDPGVTYRVRIDYDGTYFFVYIDDGLALSLEAGAPASGKAGVRVKSTNNNPATITFDRFIAY